MTTIEEERPKSGTQPLKATLPKVPKLPTLNLSKVTKLSDADDIVEPERSHGIKQFGGPKSARSLATYTQAKFKSAVSSIAQMSPRISTASKGLTPRFSIAAMLTPRTRGNLEEIVRSATAESAFNLHGTLKSDAGPLEAASSGAPIGMSSAQMEGELLLARTDLMATKKAVHIVRMSHASLDRELITAKGILSRAVNTEKDLRKALAEAGIADASNTEEVAALRVKVEALEHGTAELAAALAERTGEVAALGERLGEATDAAAHKEAELLQELWETEGALRAALREHEEMVGLGRTAASALQHSLDGEKAQRAADVSRTAQAHAGRLVEANDRIKLLERDVEAGKVVSTQLTSQLLQANVAAEAGTQISNEAHAEITLLTHSFEQLQLQAEQLISERDALAAELDHRQPVGTVGSGARGSNSSVEAIADPPSPQQEQHRGSNPLQKIFTGLLMVTVGALAGAGAQRR